MMPRRAARAARRGLRVCAHVALRRRGVRADPALCSLRDSWHLADPGGANDLLRRKIVLYNPNATAIIAYCPAGPNRDTGLPLVCAVNGAGSSTLQPHTGFVLQGSNGATRLDMPSAINVISNTPGSSYTVWDQE